MIANIPVNNARNLSPVRGLLSYFNLNPLKNIKIPKIKSTIPINRFPSIICYFASQPSLTPVLCVGCGLGVNQGQVSLN